MTNSNFARPSHFLAIFGGILVVAGMIQAAPHLLMSYHLGLSLCGAGAGIGQVAAAMLQLAEHCPGCLMALLGAGLLGLSQMSPMTAKQRAFA